ncbi:nucleotide exchange factor GrpE [Ichthyobacterium seriolicida]|uniref:Protein GrpE n=1 Tax=Ichthyobacterium seriolicida TaxID=242600 RepID=A0A1J1DZP2_9FLAO|nr:nucleotide exchange factor GrpE [Ichthyobacterium seriolicida]BAV95391.1 heat shock protein GrpE [Ichthyobacterium seriolicida]
MENVKKNSEVNSEKNHDEKVLQSEELENVDPDDVIEDEQEQEIDELSVEKDRYLRLYAEFENYKRRTTKERIELYKTAGEDVIVSMLPVLDDFDRAIKELEKTDSDSDSLKGISLIYNKFKGILSQRGLSAIKIEKGDDFNTDFHEAVTYVKSDSEDLNGKVLDVLEMGYELNEKIIRYAKVVIGK